MHPTDTPAAADYDAVHLAAVGRVDALCDELVHRGAEISGVRQQLVFSRGHRAPAAWAQTSWLDPREIAIESIGDGVRALKSLQRNWALHSTGHHRRARLIADKLPAIRFRPLEFPSAPPDAPLGAWTLIDRNRLIAAPTTSSAFAHGEPAFAEDRDNPPNRAYLKAWEALTLARRWPQAGERCLDLGAAPGGWSWVMASLGADVISIDRAPLAPEIAAHPRISHRRGDAFALRVADVGTPDWICSDLIAYPERLLELADYWCSACPRAGVILTVKCQGNVAFETLARFYAIDGARLLHLAYNKHELTFFRLPGGGPAEAAGIGS